MMYIIKEVNYGINTSKKIQEVPITCSDKLNRNGIKTMKVEKEMVTNVKEEDEVYIPIVKDIC